MTEYNASWSTPLLLISALATAALLGIPLTVYLQEGTINIILWLGPLICLVAALFTVRGYRIDTNRLFIRRLLSIGNQN